MKKIFYIAILFFAIISLTACSSEQDLNKDITQNKRPDFGQPKRKPEIMGIVKSIIGNEVTILKTSGPNRNKKTTENTEDTKQAPSVSLGANSGKTRGMGGMGGGSKGMDADSQAEIIKRMKNMSTGEEKLIIPVGIQMLKPDTVNEKIEMLEANLGDIKSDTLISVWLNQTITDRNIAEFVLVK